jgi:antitoxin VapB
MYLKSYRRIEEVALSIKDPEADRLARALASATGETLTKAVTQALRERLERVGRRRVGKSLAEELNEIALRCAALPDLDTRTPDEIIGYDEHGLPR